MQTSLPPKRITTTILTALKGGVVPRIGLEYIAVGRDREIDALLTDIERVAEGGASFRFIVGRYGSGKSFLLQTIRNYAVDRGFVVMDADLSPERRFAGSKGQGVATYRELVKNLSTKTRPDGGALPLILERWITGLQQQTRESLSGSGETLTAERLNQALQQRIQLVTAELEGMVNGFDFARAMQLYVRAYEQDDADLKSNVLRWFRGEYNTRTEARQELGIHAIVTDDNWYDYMKILARFAVLAGYRGMLVIVDELINIFKITHAATRQNNYEKILTMYNDVLQGKARHIGFLLGATPQCIEDKYKGVFSYEALRSRLADSRFAGQDTKDLLSPLIRLSLLTPEEIYVLLEKLAQMHGQMYGYHSQLCADDLQLFLNVAYNRVGASSLITPREIIRDFIDLLDLLQQNPGQTLAGLLENGGFTPAKEQPAADPFTTFEL
ncbi:DUF2791 family P-loop domain-containing protein [Oscillospiraceae bacterium HV4-5-C5C]|nr:DUF2791 family P-loop domain-containing protein [Oscillospiraceae bacterium HV4-5-C5C]